MRKLIILLIPFCAWVATAQNSFNYQAVVRDSGGNVLSNATIDLQFIIYEGAALTNNVYQETHSAVTTDANGLVTAAIGEGTTTDDFNAINWGADMHFLNIRIDTGSGLSDLGTVALRSVPYAQHALNVTGLEVLDEGNGLGWRLIGRDPANFGNIGLEAVDLSRSNSTSSTRGATGESATTLGFNTTASGFRSTAMGNGSVASNVQATAMGSMTAASGFSATAMGGFTEASGTYATAMGQDTQAQSNIATAIGRFNIGGGDPTNWVETDPLFEIGNGNSDASRTNALTVLKNGTITAPSLDLAEITDNKSLITKEYVDQSLAPTGLETLDEGNGIGWRIIGRDPLNYGDIGENAMDLSISLNSSTTKGATGVRSFAAGTETTASGSDATAIGFFTTASGNFSVAMGEGAAATNSAAVAMGDQTDASGQHSTAFGRGTLANAIGSTAIGRYNIGGGNPNVWVGTDPLFEIGNGTTSSNRANALTILKNGTITAPSLDLSEINDSKSLITKEYADQNLASTGLEALDEGSGLGWRLIGKDPVDYGSIGPNAVDLSWNSVSGSTTHGATGSAAFTAGHRTIASGGFSTALGNNTTASGASSIATGFLTTASGSASTAMGDNTDATGDASTSMGFLTEAPSYGETVIGLFNTLYTPNSTNSWHALDRLFVIGNGTDLASRSDALTVLKNGNVGIGTGTAIPNVRLDVIGSIEYTGTITDVSDRRLKENLKSVENVLTRLQKLQAYTYNMKDDQEKVREYGLIAQELQEVFPEMVKVIDSENEYLGVSYVQLIPVLLEAIKEQQTIINKQDKRYENLENRLEILEAKMNQ